MNRPYLSIVVPIYNQEKFLSICIDSILNQSFKDFELWLIDDGSTDSSIDIIKRYESIDTRIRTAFIKGNGPSIPRNYAIKRASGEYLMFIDSDDYLPEGALDILANKSKQFPSAIFIRGNQRILVDGTREAHSVFSKSRSQYADKLIPGETFMVKILDKDFAPIDSLIKLSFIKENGILFHEDLCMLEDGPFIIEIMSHNKHCVYINEETYIYRLGNPTSVTNTKPNFNKCKSLAMGAVYNASLMHHFNSIGYEHIRKRSIEHGVSAIFQAAMYLSKDQCKNIIEIVKGIWPKLPSYGYKKHDIFSKIYNINPDIALFMLRKLKPLLRK